jgi:hypothetical protein
MELKNLDGLGLNDLQKNAIMLLYERTLPISLHRLTYTLMSGFAEVMHNKKTGEIEVAQSHAKQYDEDWELVVRMNFIRNKYRPLRCLWEFEVNNKIIYSKIFLPYNESRYEKFKPEPGRYWY